MKNLIKISGRLHVTNRIFNMDESDIYNCKFWG